MLRKRSCLTWITVLLSCGVAHLLLCISCQSLPQVSAQNDENPNVNTNEGPVSLEEEPHDDSLEDSVVGDMEEVIKQEEEPTLHFCQGRLALITGATGNVGRLVTHQLVDQGYCVRLLTRNATKADEIFKDLLASDAKNQVEVVVGQLGDGTSVSQAFAPRESSGKVPISHVVFAAGGEEADFDAVNNRGVAECAQAAAHQSSPTKIVVISAMWVTKPYSLASLLFNSLYDNLPMARHLQGEDALRQWAITNKNLEFVVLRAGRLVSDHEFPATAPRGLTYGQGDDFFFWGLAGAPGMCNTQLADAVVTALSPTVQGKYIVEVTGGTIHANDATVYSKFQPDDGSNLIQYDDVTLYHAKAMKDLQLAVAIFGFNLLLITAFLVRGGIWKRLTLFLLGWMVFILGWTFMLGPLSVWDCATKDSKNSMPATTEL